MVKKIAKVSFDTTHERDRHTDRQTDRHRMTASRGKNEIESPNLVYSLALYKE